MKDILSKEEKLSLTALSKEELTQLQSKCVHDSDAWWNVVNEFRRRWWVEQKSRRYIKYGSASQLIDKFNKIAEGRFEATPPPFLNSGMALIEVKFVDDAEALESILQELQYSFTVTDSEKEDWYKQFAINLDEVGFIHGLQTPLNCLCRACGLPVLIPFAEKK